MSKRWIGVLQYAAIVVVSAVVAIGLAEAYLAARAAQPGALPFYGQLYPYVMFRPQSNLRYVSSETFVMSHHTEQVHHYTNEDGLRVSAPDYELPRAKPPGQLRVAVLGGSAVEIATTFETTLPGSLKTLLREKYPGRDIEVINAGIQSSVSRQSVIHLMFTVAEYEPDIVVLYDGHNDIGMPLMYDARPNFPYNFQVMQEAWGLLSSEARGFVVAGCSRPQPRVRRAVGALGRGRHGREHRGEGPPPGPSRFDADADPRRS